MVTKYQQANKIPIVLVRLNLVEDLAQIPNCSRIGVRTAERTFKAAGKRKGSSDGRHGEGNRPRGSRTVVRWRYPAATGNVFRTLLPLTGKMGGGISQGFS